ncbi:YlbF family regulator [Streptococcus sp. DD12]|uniref:YlbF family regulator n=1 Tax=Streptococcus sp. DD12 TaxID=1777880 RepID=UPI0007953D59|nr:YlbF family regulator [Streptococcus sp. DD12]KXT76073.1 hypothetical protein STRDD12_01185 [Streptococcus sp. DD12]
MMQWEEETDKLAALLKNHSSVQAFLEVKTRLEKLPELQDKVGEMKDHQQEAVFFNKIEKEQAYLQADEEAIRLQDDLSQLPVVVEYRQKMQDASDLLYHVTKAIEEGINKGDNL